MCLDGLHLGIRTSFFSTRFAPSLPTQILFADGNTIRYTYNADGHKLRAEYTTAMPATTKTINYCSNLIFENGTLKQILVDGGYIMMDDWSHPYCFYIKDHLGNNRMVVNQRGTVDQVNNYYPYGGLIANSTGWNAQRYKYNGKEFDRMHGLDWYDYGARWQDAAIGGRWHAMDPLAEKYYDISPYVYCMNNPVRFVDPDGRKWVNSVGQDIGNNNQMKMYIFYSAPFEEQAMKQYQEGISRYGEGNVALSLTSTTEEFSEDWKNMIGESIEEVLIMTHGKNQSITLSDGHQFTSTGDGVTNITHSDAPNIQDLPLPIGNINNATLYMYSCHSMDNVGIEHEGQGALAGTKQPIGHAFVSTFNFSKVVGTRGSINYHSFSTDFTFPCSFEYLKPYPKDGVWIYATRKKTK